MERSEFISEIQSAEAVVIPFSIYTKLPFIAEDVETADDEIFLFLSDNEAIQACQDFTQSGDPVRPVKFTRDNLPDFLGSLNDYGINAICCFKGEDNDVFQMSDLIRQNPSGSRKAADLPPVNPSLSITMMYMAQESRKQSPNNEFVESHEKELHEHIERGEYIIPLTRSLSAENANSASDKDEIQLSPLIMGIQAKGAGEDAEPERWLPLFTSIHEVKRAGLPSDVRLNKVNYDGAQMFMKELNLNGLVIDPASVAMSLPNKAHQED